MDYLKGYRVARQDPQWVNKIVVGSCILLTSMIIPLVGQLALIGWQAMIMRRAVHGQDEPLPRLDFDFDYLGKLVGLGFKALIARFLWTLPMMVLGGAAFVCMYFGIFAVAIGGAAAASQGGEAGAAFGSMGAICCMGGGYFGIIIMAILMTIPANVAAMRAELTDDLNPAMKFGEVMAFSKLHFGTLVKGTLLLGVVAWLLSMVGVLACGIGIFPVAILGMVAHAHFLAQVYQQHVAQGGDPLPLAGPELTPPGGRPPPGGGPPQQQWPQQPPPQTF